MRQASFKNGQTHNYICIMNSSNNINRRKFLGTAAATAATITIVPRHVVAGSGQTPPSEQIRIANIGCGTQGLREMRYLLEDDRLRVVAVCDPNKLSSNYLDWSANEIRDRIREDTGDTGFWEGKPGIPGGREIGKMYVDKYYAKNVRSGKYNGCTAYEDFRELLEKEDIDAVKIMTPDHLHAPIALAALGKGLDTITHKPIANRMAEARKVIDKAKATDAITHLLAWGDMPQIGLIKHWMDDGVIGELKEIHNWSARPVWQQWISPPTKEVPIPKSLNWDLWLGPVPDMPYHPNYTNNVFRGWYNFGGGSIADMGHYSWFPLFEALGVNRPATSALAYGTTARARIGNTFKPANQEASFPPSCMIHFKMPKQPTLPAFDLYWYDGGMKPFPPQELEARNTEMPLEGLMLVGDQGKILCGFRGQEPRMLPLEKMRTYDGPKSVKSQESYVEYPWVDHLVQRTQSPGSFIRAQTVTETINLGAIALRTGTRVDYDTTTMRITNNEDANKFLTREYRPGWEI